MVKLVIMFVVVRRPELTLQRVRRLRGQNSSATLQCQRKLRVSSTTAGIECDKTDGRAAEHYGNTILFIVRSAICSCAFTANSDKFCLSANRRATRLDAVELLEPVYARVRRRSQFSCTAMRAQKR